MKITQVERKAGNSNDTVLAESNINYIYSSRDEGIEDAYILISLAPATKGAQHRYEIELDLADARRIAEDLVQWIKYYESDPLQGQDELPDQRTRPAIKRINGEYEFVDERDYLVGEGY